ncbi:sulfate permease [Rubidibacter lacunae KORDI 51-2]|uniref:Sulfate permease n=1 Tax=Rubidibacter lacunae KORDI 51-2 TaxID=582515 RepID=U5DNE8_9CHRO|nr:cyclic nucleotide-binding domain-containing protein [Rubidibacter lacunae]ERN43191.1 sulfate permease [Rubidibacter lacunae KORDI 51-2]
MAIGKYGARLCASLVAELRPPQLLASTIAGGLSGLAAIVPALALAADLFGGPLEPLLPLGVLLVFFSTAIARTAIALGSQWAGAIAVVRPEQVVLLGAVASATYRQLSVAPEGADAVSTVAGAIALASVASGAVALAVGLGKVGSLARYVPSPPIGGLFAGLGWLLVRAGVLVATGLPLRWDGLGELLQAPAIWQWLTALLFALAVLESSRFRHRKLAIGLGALIGTGLFYLLLLLLQVPVSEARAVGWLLGPFATDDANGVGTLLLPLSRWQRFNWEALATPENAILVLALAGISVLAVAIALDELNLAAGRDLDLDVELRVAGCASLLAGLGTGGTGVHGADESLEARQYGGRGRLTGILSGLVLAIAATQLPSILSVCPRPIVGGLSILLGIEILEHWLIATRARLLPGDYALQLAIALAIVVFGFPTGAALGLVMTVVASAARARHRDRLEAQQFGPSDASVVLRPPHQRTLLRTRADCIYAAELRGYLFPGTVYAVLEHLYERERAPDREPLAYAIVDFRAAIEFDSAAVRYCRELQHLAARRNWTAIVSGLSPAGQYILRKNGCHLVDAVETVGAVDAESEAMLLFPDLAQAVGWCENELLMAAPPQERRFLPLAEQLKQRFADDDNAMRFMGYLEPMRLTAGDRLFRRGEETTGLYFLETGRISLQVAEADDRWRIVCVYEPGTLFGANDLYRAQSHSTDAVAERDSRLYRLTMRALSRMEALDPELALTCHRFVLSWAVALPSDPPTRL